MGMLCWDSVYCSMGLQQQAVRHQLARLHLGLFCLVVLVVARAFLLLADDGR